MKTERTIRKQMRELFATARCAPNPVSSKAYEAATALQWVLEKTDWTPARLLREEYEKITVR